MQTDYLTFGNLITTSDTPKVQPSEAIAVEEYLLKVNFHLLVFRYGTGTGKEKLSREHAHLNI